jgi:hypothetical protein
VTDPLSERVGSGGGASPYRTTNLIDILDRVLDKGLVVAGDVRISLANVELLTIRIRLLICSVDKAEQIGLNWWRYDPNLVHPTSSDGQAELVARLEARVAELERQLVQRAVPGGRAPAARPPGGVPRRRRSQSREPG